MTKTKQNNKLDKFSEKLKKSEYDKIYYQNNKIKIQQRRINSSEKIKESRKRYYENNKDIIYKRNKKYCLKNKNKLKIYHKEYKKKRRNLDSSYKLIGNIRTKIYQSIKLNIKHKSTIELLGCSIEELKKHLELKFKKGMSWENYSKKGWHIDHIIPCASFELSDPEQQKVCFHYTNLQPLWWWENLSKADKL